MLILVILSAIVASLIGGEYEVAAFLACGLACFGLFVLAGNATLKVLDYIDQD